MVKNYYIQQNEYFYRSALYLKVERVMKLACLLLCLSINVVFASYSNAQKSSLSVNVQQKTIAEVLDLIEEQSDFHFFYNSKLVNVNQKVSLFVKDKDAISILSMILENTNIQFKVVGNDVILTTDYSSHVTQQQDSRIIIGTIKDEVNDSPVIGANIVIKGTAKGTTTDIDGKFSLEVTDTDVLLISYIGYTPR